MAAGDETVGERRVGVHFEPGESWQSTEPYAQDKGVVYLLGRLLEAEDVDGDRIEVVLKRRSRDSNNGRPEVIDVLGRVTYGQDGSAVAVLLSTDPSSKESSEQTVARLAHVGEQMARMLSGLRPDVPPATQG